MRSISRLVLATLLLVLPGCSFSGAPSWLQGDWIYDLDASQKAATVPAQPSSVTGIFDGMANAMSGMILPAFSGMEMRITDREVMVIVNGNGQSLTYQVVGSVPDQECLIKQSDGTLVTFYKAGDEIYRYPDKGGAKIKIFFKRKS
ncbi:MAG: hypothetical protein LV480_13530 [Methylacidiphilales bacterium]|nr:hypothetical protein [Candidatus Methylacidiphilales bacterium]